MKLAFPWFLLFLIFICSLRCPPGHYCEADTKTQYQSPCPDGTFYVGWGLEREEQCTPCQAGYTCTGGDPTGDELCPHGHYCLVKDTQCPTGTGIGVNNISPCKCPAGKFTEERGATRTFTKHISLLNNSLCAVQL